VNRDDNDEALLYPTVPTVMWITSYSRHSAFVETKLSNTRNVVVCGWKFHL